MGSASLDVDVMQVLTKDELALISDFEDAKFIARVKLMTPDELVSYQSFKPRTLRHYNFIQLEWMETSKWLLGTRLKRDPSNKEAFEDYIANNSLRFRAFYTIKFPYMVAEPRQLRRAS